MANCIGKDKTVKADNGEESILYDTLYMITENNDKAKSLYNYFLKEEFKEVFGDYKKLQEDTTDLTKLRYEMFRGRIDENGQPKLFYDDLYNSYYFTDMYNNRVYYPLKNDKLNNIFTSEETKEITQAISAKFITNFEFDEDLIQFINKNESTLSDFVDNYLTELQIDLMVSEDFMKMEYADSLEKSQELYLEEWVNKTKIELKRLKFNLRTKEEYIRTVEENEGKNELIKKESFEKDFKDNVNNNIKLMLSLIPSSKKNFLDMPKNIAFEEVYINLLEKLVPVIQNEQGDKFKLLVKEVKKLVKVRPEYKHLVEETEENNFYPLFSLERSPSFKAQVVNAFDLVPKNLLQSEIELDNGNVLYSFKNISEISNRKNIELKEWQANLNEKELTAQEIKQIIQTNIDPLVNSINKEKETYKDLNDLLSNNYKKIKYSLNKLGINVNEPSLKYFLNNNNLDSLSVEKNTNNLLSLLNSIKYFSKEKIPNFKSQSNLVKFAAANAFFMERVSDSSVNTMGKQKWTYGNRTFLDTQINEWIDNPIKLQEKFEKSGTVQNGSTYIKYLLGYINKQGAEEYNKTEKARLEKAKERLTDLKTFYFNGIQQKGDIENASDSKNISRADMILDNINKLLSFKVGGNPTSKTSLASDKASSIELQYNFSVDTNLKIINDKYSFSKQTEDIIFDFINAEYKRIKKTYEEINNLEENELVNNIHIGNKNGLKFFTIRDLNDPMKLGVKLFNEEGTPLFDSLDDSSEVKDIIVSFINKSLGAEIVKTKNKLLNNKILKRDLNGELTNNLLNNSIFEYYKKEKGSNAIDSLVADYFVNSYISQIEYHNLFTGDMAYYKSPVDYIKRVSESYTDGQYLSNYNEKRYFTAAVIDSVEIDPVNIEKIKNKIIKELYRNSNSADGQAWITPERWKFIKKGTGKWNSLDDIIYSKMFNKNATFTKEESKRLAIPLKGVHFELKGTNVPIYLKYSQAVLVPSIIKNMPELQAMYDRMRDKNDPIDELLTADAIKVGARGSIVAHTPEGAVTNLDNLNTFQLQNKYWKLQQDLPTKGYKQTTIGSQLKEIILQGLLGLGNETRFELDNDGSYTKEDMFGIINTVMADKSNIGLNKIQALLGIEGNDNVINNKDLLYKKVLSQLESRDITENTLNALLMGVSPYGIPGQAEVFQNQFSTLVNGETVEIKTNGGSFIQASSFGFNFSQLTDKNNDNGIVLTPAGKKAIANKESRLHMPEVYKGEDGRTKVRPGGVFLAGSLIADYLPDYKSFTTEELFGILNEETNKYEGGIIDHEILESIISYRIPNQSLASNDAFEVLGFLPEEMSDTIVPYTGFTTKTGSDFDIDKLYLMIPSFKTKYEKNDLNSIRNGIKNDFSIEELREELINQGYNINYIKGKNNIIDYVMEDLYLNNQDFYNRSILDRINGIVNNLKIKEVKLEYIKPLTIEELKTGNTDFIDYESKLNNLLVNSFKSILTNPDVFDKLINPIDIPFMQENIEALAPPVEREGMNYFNSLEDAYTREEYMEGKKGLGIMINQMMDSIRGSFTPYKVNLSLGNGKTMDSEKSETLSDKELQEYRYFYNKSVKEYNKNNEKNKKELTKEDVNELKSLKLEDAMTALVNAFVDIAKDPYVFRGNWNTKTTNLGTMLLRKGVHPFKVNAFLSNPTIKSFIEFSALQDSVSSEGKGNHFIKFILNDYFTELEDTTIEIKGNPIDVRYFILDIINRGSGITNDLAAENTDTKAKVIRFFDKYKKEIKEEYKDNDFISDNLNDFIIETRRLVSSNIIKIRKSHKDLKKKASSSLSDKFNLTELNNKIEKADTSDIPFLYMYDYLQNLSDKLSLNVKSNSYRVNGKGKNVSSTIVAKNLVLKAAGKTSYKAPFENYMERFESTDGFKNNLKQVFENSIEEPLKIMKENSSLFIAGNEMAIRSFNFIAMLSSDNGLLTNQKLADSLERAYMSYIVSGFNPFKEANPTKFIEEFNEEFSNMKSKDSLIGNKILQELNVVDGVIQTRGTKKLVNAENDLIDAWSSLESSNPEFSEKLAKYSYLTSSFLTGPTTFHQYIPVSFFNKNYFNNYLSSKVEEINLDKKSDSIDFNFIKQFAEHNLDNPMLSGKNKLVNKVEDSFYLVKDTPGLKITNKKIKPNEKGIKFIYNWNISETVNSDMMDILLRSEVVVKKKIISQVNLTNMPLFKNPINVRSAFKDVVIPKEVEKEVEEVKDTKEFSLIESLNDRVDIQYPENISIIVKDEVDEKEYSYTLSSLKLMELSNVPHDKVIPYVEKENYEVTINKLYGEDALNYVSLTGSEVSISEGKFIKSNPKFIGNFNSVYLNPNNKNASGETLQGYAKKLLEESDKKYIDKNQLDMFGNEITKDEIGFNNIKDKWLDSGRTENDWNSMTIEERNNEIGCL